MILRKKVLALVLVSALATLTACGGKDGAKDNNADKGSAQSAGSDKKEAKPDASGGDSAVSEKVNDYIKLNNSLMDTNSLASRSEYFAQQAAKTEEAVKKGDFKKIKSSSAISNASESLEKILAKTDAKLAELDKSAEELKTAIDTHLPKWEELEAYNKAKKYEDDDGAKGKELLPNYLEAQEKLQAAREKFDVQVKIAGAIEKDKRIAEYKKEGRMLELSTEEAMEKAAQMLAMFESEKDLKDKTKIEQTNKMLVELEAHLEQMQKEQKLAEEEKEKNKGKGGGIRNLSSYNSIHSYLIDFTANYREARKGNFRKYNSMVSDYNRAVGSINRRM